MMTSSIRAQEVILDSVTAPYLKLADTLTVDLALTHNSNVPN